MVLTFREEFRLQNISLFYSDYASFAKSKWMSMVKYLIYRWIIAIFFIVSILLDRDYYGGWYTGYFTGWGLSTITIYVTIYAILCSYQFYNSRNHHNITIQSQNTDNDLEMQSTQSHEDLHPGIVWGYRIVWMLFNIAAINSIIVSLGYWGAIHSKYGKKSLVGRLGYHNIASHLLNAVVMLIEAIVAPFPVRLLHFVYSNLYGLLYIASTVIYWLASGKTKKFYDFLDYSNKPGLAVIVVVVGFLILQPLIQLLFYGIYRLRELVLNKKAGSNLNNHTELQTGC